MSNFNGSIFKKHFSQQREREAAKIERKVQHEKRRKCEKAYGEWLTDKARRQATSAQRESSALKDKLKEIDKVGESIKLLILCFTNNLCKI